LSYQVVSVSPYEKRYAPTQPGPEVARKTPPTSFLAYVGGEMAGRIEVSEHWNGFATVNTSPSRAVTGAVASANPCSSERPPGRQRILCRA